MTPDNDNDAGMLIAGSGVEVSERERFSDLQVRAGALGYTLRALRSGLVLERGNRRVHLMTPEGVTEQLGAEERKQ